LRELRTKEAWAVFSVGKRHSYYRAFEDGDVYFKVAKGEKAEMDTKRTKMELCLKSHMTV
ncbi:MAG: hypothetical protein M1835_003071, partial [Candelina submexicana]